MKVFLKNIAIVSLMSLNAFGTIECNGIENNRTAYELTTLAADAYLNYTYVRGAGSSNCSQNGARLCKILSQLKERIRLFHNPERPDLKQLSAHAAQAFRNFDLTGSNRDKVAFANSLTNLLQATLPLLSETEENECKMMINQVKQTI